MTLTNKQHAVIAYIRDYLSVWSVPPTQMEIAAHLGISRQMVAKHLRVLEGKGVISIRRGIARGCQIATYPAAPSRAKLDHIT